MIRAVVTGAGGFIGHHLVKYLKNKHYWVIGIDIKKPEFEPTFADEFIVADLRNYKDCFHAVFWEYINEVYHLAANMGGIGFIENNKAEIVHDNVLINMNMLEVCRIKNVKNFLFSSSACIYPGYKQASIDIAPLKEEDAYPADPEDGYGWEKLYTERACRHYREDYGLPTHVVRFHNIFGPCFDEQTEVLTEKGFKFFKDVSYEDKIATLNPINEMLEYHKPLAIQNYNYNDYLYQIDSSIIDLAVTPDHSFYFAARGRGKKLRFSFDKASFVIDTYERFNFKRNVNWKTNEEFFNYELVEEVNCLDGRTMKNRGGMQKEVDLKLWLRFLGWYLSEGSCFVTPTNYTVSVSNYNVVNQKEIVDIVNKMGYKCFVNGGKNVVISSKQLYEKVKKFGGSAEKFIPRKYLFLPKDYLECLFDTLMKGDGDKKRNRYSTVSKQLSDDFQELVFKLGFSSVVSKDKKDEKRNDIYRVRFGSRHNPTIKQKHISKINYSGKVYDVTVPNHIIFVRRNGKTCWSGNCGTYEGGREKSPAAICRKVYLAKDGGNIEIWGDGKQKRSYCYIDDCVKGIYELMQSNFYNPLNLGTDRMISIDELVDIVCKIAGKNLIKVHDLTKSVGVRGRNSDNTLLRKVLGWEPPTTLENGLRKTYKWIRDEI